jgi:pimeloyl-ACP methyl ester carboxylesterase
MSAPTQVASADGTRIAVFESGRSKDAPTIVAVHGYPDNHTVWDGVIAHLSPRFRVVAYDVRGAGDSDKPQHRAAYRIDRLLADFTAVIDAVSPDRPVHLLAHDWGSIQAWGFVTDPRLQARIASFTSISGPSLDHVAMRMRNPRKIRAALRQPLDSYYMALMQIPGLMELVWRSGIGDRSVARAERVGRSPGDATVRTSRSDADKINGMNLYRANVFQRLARPRPGRTDIPVQVIAPTEDRFANTPLQFESPEPFVTDLRLRTVAGGHWVIANRPDLIATMTAEFIDSVDQRTPTAISSAASSSSK